MKKAIILLSITFSLTSCATFWEVSNDDNCCNTCPQEYTFTDLVIDLVFD